MGDEVSLADDGTANQEPTTTDAPPFAAQWQPTDTTSLLPGNLPLARPRRAYERAPASPFTRRQIRVGKIFKRAAPSVPLKAATRRDPDTAVLAEGSSKLVSSKLLRLQAKADAMAPSPLKVLKKRCLPARGGDEEGRVGTRAQIVGWENRGREVLGRKIVTRSGRRSAGGEGQAGLVALAEEGESGLVDEVEGEDLAVSGLSSFEVDDVPKGEEELEIEGTIVEIVDENGRAVEGGEGDEDAEDWSDVEPETEEPGSEAGDLDEILDVPGDTSDAEDDALELASDPRAEHTATQIQEAPGLDVAEEEQHPIEHPRIETDELEPNREFATTTDTQQSLGKEATIAASTGVEPVQPMLASEATVLPEGFVSPTKRAPRTSRRTVKEALAARRRTLPVQFAPPVNPEQTSSSAPRSFDDTPNVTEAAQVNHISEQVPELLPSFDENVSVPTEEAWEDVPGNDQAAAGDHSSMADETCDSRGTLTQDIEDASPAPVNTRTEYASADVSDVEPTMISDNFLLVNVPEESQMIENIVVENTVPDLAQAPSSSTVTKEHSMPGSPVENAIPTQQPSFTTRKSPRRKSTSPIKTQQHAVLKGSDIPHLVAFSPIKRLEVHYSTDAIPALHLPTSEAIEDTTVLATGDTTPEIASPFQRSSSAPPEEPKMSPQRPSRPRVSDDTALLQAFLSRAAANKVTKRATTARRESASNRRDSETVKQALASPAKPEVLVDLDPNTSSPRKAATAEDEYVPEPENAEKPDDKDDITYEPRPKTRRSTRDKKRAPQNLLSAQTSPPNRIAVRGRADPVVLKKSEAQEVALSTRNNTRKNKGGSVLPHLRLTKLVTEIPPEAQNMPEDPEQQEAVPIKKGIKWDETLTYFFEVPAREVGLLELGDSGAVSRLQTESAPLEDVEEVEMKPPPPADTPSKPKVRRLKPPKPTAASAAAKGVSATPTTATADTAKPTDPTPTATKAPASRKPRSRIATPAAKRTVSPPTEKGEEAAPTVTETPSLTDSTLQPRAQKPSALPKTRRPAAVSKLPAPASTAAATNLGASLLASPAKKRKAPMPDPLPTSISALTTTSAPGKGKMLPGPKFAASVSEQGRGNGELGLASPAKKPRGRVGFAGDVGGSGEEGKGMRAGSGSGSGLFGLGSGLGLGLSSPAKRRKK